MYRILFYENRRGENPVLEYIEKLALRDDKDSRIKFDNVMDCIDQLRMNDTRATEKFVTSRRGDNVGKIYGYVAKTVPSLLKRTGEKFSSRIKILCPSPTTVKNNGDDFYMSNQSQLNLPTEYRAARIDGISTPFFFRPIEEDAALLNSIFGGGEYWLPLKNFHPKLILDCGGNIGCAAVYFANKYPDAQIYSVEPEKENFRFLQYNTCFYDNIHPIKSALWDKETFIRVEDRGFGKWGYMTFETTADDSAAFKTTTVAKILADSGFNEIDLLKIDIEGAEKEVFAAPDVEDWLPKVKVLTIELHDRMKRGCSYEFFKAISKYKWFFTFRGENLIFIRDDLLKN